MKILSGLNDVMKEHCKVQLILLVALPGLRHDEVSEMPVGTPATRDSAPAATTQAGGNRMFGGLVWLRRRKWAARSSYEIVSLLRTCFRFR